MVLWLGNCRFFQYLNGSELLSCLVKHFENVPKAPLPYFLNEGVVLFNFLLFESHEILLVYHDWFVEVLLAQHVSRDLTKDLLSRLILSIFLCHFFFLNPGFKTRSSFSRGNKLFLLFFKVFLVSIEAEHFCPFVLPKSNLGWFYAIYWKRVFTGGRNAPLNGQGFCPLEGKTNNVDFIICDQLIVGGCDVSF